MHKLPGVHAPHWKNSASFSTEIMPPPNIVRIPMGMHIGAPAKPVVAVGDSVKVGQLIGEAAGFISANIHASVSGIVKAILDAEPATGERGTIIVIESDGKMEQAETVAPVTVTNKEEFLAAVRASGAVGLGGAGFPTAAKLTVKDGVQLDYIFINGAECEPYITSDTRTFLEDTEYVTAGVKMLAEYLQPLSIGIAIEVNKPEAIDVMRECFEGDSLVQVAPLPSMYPQGGEKMLIHNLTGRDVPEGKLPLDVGCIVINVTTLAKIAKYIMTGEPLISKRITVDGTAVRRPRNVQVPIGTSIADVLEYCNVNLDPVGKVLYGGPMMGIAVPSVSLPVKKNTNAIIALGDYDAQVPKPTPCLRCGRCVSHCPMRLTTVEIQNAFLAKKPEVIEKLKVGLCIECGCCTFACPAKRPLTQYMKLAKADLRTYQAEKKAAAEREAARLQEKQAKQAGKENDQ